MPVPVETAIQQYTREIIYGKIPRPKGCCPRCLLHPINFKLHECRKRTFRYIDGNFVKELMTLLPRWKCSSCRKTFTVYPSFASPYKRYVLEDIEKISKKYMGDEQQTYDTAVNNKGSSIGYEEKGDKNVDHFLAPSTLWRWIRWLMNTKNSSK